MVTEYHSLCLYGGGFIRSYPSGKMSTVQSNSSDMSLQLGTLSHLRYHEIHIPSPQQNKSSPLLGYRLNSRVWTLIVLSQTS